ncbi:hypothetical protein ACSRUE_06055 [Sorangium sp. KYC3313]|uniref:hypothetical protein n=1 Tax=Sorangium sp. KYC3313 TaxID=3449740 RepID=UPI003F89AE30
MMLALLLVGPFIAAARRRRALERARFELEVEIDALEYKLRLGGMRSPGDSPYR